jgi:hypothetical protein
MKQMFEFVKKILEKVSFDRELFRKELSKGVKVVSTQERMMLYTWCIATFGHMYRDVIFEVFKR